MSEPKKKLPCPFAEGVIGTGFLPNNSDETTGRAGWSGGFPEVTAKPISAGGIPPHYSDFQMALNGITQQVCFLQSGGRYRWDSTLNYDPGSVVLWGGKVWQCLPGDGDNAGDAPGGPGEIWAELAAVDGTTIIASGGKMSVAPQNIADGKTIVSSGSKLAVNMNGVAGAGLVATIVSGQPKLNVNYSVAASDLAGSGLRAESGQLHVISQGGTTRQALTFSVAGTSKWVFDGAAARTIDIKGTANQINVGYTNGAAVLSLDQKAVFPTGTIMLFHGTAAPSGWTLVSGAAYNDAALRLITATNTGTSGTNTFTKAFNAAMGTNSVQARGSVAPHRLSVNEIPPHSHKIRGHGVAHYCGTYCVDCGDRNSGDGYAEVPTFNTGGGAAHSHTFTGEYHTHTVTLNVKYVNVFFAKKNP